MLLQTVDLSVAFGGLRAVSDVSITVEPGTLVGLIGPNGAGKTTFIDAVTGFVPSTGRVLFEGREVNGLEPHRRARAGLVRTWQSLELFDDLDIRENLLVAAERAGWKSLLLDVVRPGRRTADDRVHAALDRLGLSELAARYPSEISQGQRKLVGVARALAADPRLVCMDEPAAGLDSDESAELGRHLRELVDEGDTIFLVDHDMGLVLNVCDYLYVIEFGQLIARGTPSEIRADDRVIAAYLGEQARKEKQAAAATEQAAIEAARLLTGEPT
jgi:branched-chain amino acid transport system ATP-binding protein